MELIENKVLTARIRFQPIINYEGRFIMAFCFWHTNAKKILSPPSAKGPPDRSIKLFAKVQNRTPGYFGLLQTSIERGPVGPLALDRLRDINCIIHLNIL